MCKKEFECISEFRMNTVLEEFRKRGKVTGDNPWFVSVSIVKIVLAWDSATEILEVEVTKGPCKRVLKKLTENLGDSCTQENEEEINFDFEIEI